MPLTDQDTVQIRRVSRQGQNAIEIEFEWFDSAGASMGVHLASWPNFDEMKATLEQQTVQDVIRTLMATTITRVTGAFRGSYFDGLAGKSFEILQRLREITP